MTLYYEDLCVGQRLLTQARTVTEADVVQFAMLSGDWNLVHTDVEFARETAYGQRVVHGLLGFAIMTGLMDRAGFFSGSAIALLGIRDWRFERPIFIGDTIRCEIEITAMRKTSKEDRGIVGRRMSLLNQRDEILQEGQLDVMLRLLADSAAKD